MDRLNENGIIAFITNRSFIDSRTFDGFRKTIQTDFDHAYIIDTKSDVRANPKIAGTTHNVFGIQAGVAILLLVKSTTGKIKEHNCKIQYVAMEDEWRKEEKLQWLAEHPIEKIEFENITPDKNNNWINIEENDWENLIPSCSKDVKAGKSKDAVFLDFTIGTNTARDEWVYDFDSENLINKLTYFVETYNKILTANGNYVNDTSIKWTRGLKQRFDKGNKLKLNTDFVIKSLYRPFVKAFLYHSSDLVEMPSLLPKLTQQKNKFICFSGSSHAKSFQTYCTSNVFSFDFLEKTTGIPFFSFDKSGNKQQNITDWGLEQFRQQYAGARVANLSKVGNPEQGIISKEDIFHYVYAVLHHPAYRTKYELNLKREFPRIPFYDNFWQWAAWGKQLMELHINYEKAEPFALQQIEITYELTNAAAWEKMTKAKLKANKAAGSIELDGFTTLEGIPATAWDYKLGNRSALEWILDQYKEKKPTDPTIAEKFNTYKFADYKEQVIDLLKRVCTVSVETMKIVNSMPE